jgi:hypothetical protein
MAHPADQEDEWIASATEQLPTLDRVNKVGEALATAISTVEIPAGAESPPRLKALWFMAILCFRALRAASWVVRVGYEDQALANVRVVDELFNRARRVGEDHSGEYARQWFGW